MIKYALKRCSSWKTNILQSVRFALSPNLPTKSHRQGWEIFEKILVQRSNGLLIFSLFSDIKQIITGDSFFDLYEEYYHSGKPMNKEFADATITYIKVVEYVLLALMPVLLLLNLYSDRVCNLYPVLFAIRLSGIFLIPIDYGKLLDFYQKLIVSIYFGFTVFNYKRSVLAFTLPVIA